MLITKKMGVVWYGVLLLGLIFSMGSCASTGKTTVKKELTTSLGKYKNIAAEAVSHIDQSKDIELMLEGQIIKKLREIKSFENVISYRLSPKKKHDLRVKATLADLDRMPAAARDLFGSLAGSGKVVVLTELVDTEYNKVVSKFFIEGTATYRSATPQAVRRVADEIKVFFEKNM